MSLLGEICTGLKLFFSLKERGKKAIEEALADKIIRNLREFQSRYPSTLEFPPQYLLDKGYVNKDEEPYLGGALRFLVERKQLSIGFLGMYTLDLRATRRRDL